MTTSGNVPSHLIVGAKTGFLAAVPKTPMPWQQVANQLPMGQAALTMVDLGAAPMPTEDFGGRPQSDYIEKTLTVKPHDWRVTVGISYNAVQDDQTGSLLTKVKGAAANFQRHINGLVFKAIDAADAATYGLCYDGLYFASASHKDAGAHYTTVQANLGALALSMDNFKSTRVLANKLMDDQGEKVNFNYDLLVVPPDLEWTAGQITQNKAVAGTANNDINPYAGITRYIVSPELSSTAWALVASGESAKPITVIMRDQPGSQDYGFDSKAADGGRYWFTYYARYWLAYGDWRLFFLGNT
jgi:phage major head subunit gpT-like protein